MNTDMNRQTGAAQAHFPRMGTLLLIALLVALPGLAGCHGHLKHVDGPGHSEDAPGQQKKH